MQAYRVALQMITMSSCFRLLVASSKTDQQLSIWQIDSPEKNVTFWGPTKAVEHMVFSPDTQFLMVATRNSTELNKIRIPGFSPLNSPQRFSLLHKPLLTMTHLNGLTNSLLFNKSIIC